MRAEEQNKMDFQDFSELREFVRSYNSTSILEVGTKICWNEWGTQYSNSREWLQSNTKRNYSVRIMLLASAGNPHRRKKISIQQFNNLINAYYNFDGHTISNKSILEEEAKVLLKSILQWEHNHEKEVRNWSLKLSSVLGLTAIHAHMAGLFLQRLVAFQNAGFGHPVSRLNRAIKFIDLLNKRSNNEFSDDFGDFVNTENYFRQFVACLALFNLHEERKGFCDFSRLPNFDEQLQESGINSENLKLFAQQNSAIFSDQAMTSFRGKISQTLNSVPDYYQPFFYNHLLEVPIVKINDEEFCLPDPFSFTESCWNQVRFHISKNNHGNRLNHLLSGTYEDYLKNVLFPFICPNSFKRIPEVENPSSGKDKRADFLITNPDSYIVVECKSCVMHSDTSAYFQAEKVADLWCRIHSACEQISNTVNALNLHDKPVIPLILTFYDSIAASTVFEEIVKRTNYCSLMGLNMPPIVHSLHEFEHWISDRSISNWSELVIPKQNSCLPIPPDGKGHNYQHLDGFSIF